MNKDPLVSILMPAFNVEKFIAAAIGSILDQDHPNWELLILDDASTDSTFIIVNTFTDDRIKVFRHDENQGYLLSCNELFGKATGEFITFLDADDTCSPNRIDTCLKAFEQDSDLDFLTTDHIRVNEMRKTISQHATTVDYERYASNSSYYPTICCATIFLRKTLLEKVGGYHPFFNGIGGEDYHWLFRLSRAGNGKHVSGSLYSYRMHPDQIHLKNTDPLKFFVEDIDREIREGMLHDGVDLLDDAIGLKQHWNAKLKNEPSLLLFRQAEFSLNHGMAARALLIGTKALLHSSFSASSWLRFLRLVYSACVRKLRPPL